MSNDEILENYRKATKQYLDYFMQIAEPDVLCAVNDAIKGGKCGLLLEISHNPFTVALKMTNDEERILLSTLAAQEQTEH